MTTKLEWNVRYSDGTLGTESKIIPNHDKSAPDKGKSSLFHIKLRTEDAPVHLDFSCFRITRDENDPRRRYQYVGFGVSKPGKIVFVSPFPDGTSAILDLRHNDFNLGLKIRTEVNGVEREVMIYPVEEPVVKQEAPQTLLETIGAIQGPHLSKNRRRP